MKKTILSIAIVLALFSTSFANHPSDVNDRAIASFQKDFYKATDVSWTESGDFTTATFSVGKETKLAYYDYQGNLIGVVQHILTTSLPARLQKDIKKHYGNYWVSELFKVSYEEGTCYYVQLKNADETIVLSTEASGGWHKYALPKGKN